MEVRRRESPRLPTTCCVAGRSFYAESLMLGRSGEMGRFVGEAVRFYEFGGTGTGEGVLVFELHKTSGKIVHQWVTGEVRE